MKNLIQNKIFLIIMLVIIIIALPVAVYLVQQQQKLKSRAAVIINKATLALSPSTKNDATVNSEFSVDLILDVTAQAQLDSFSISAVDVTIEFDNSLEMTGFTVEPGRFNRVLMPTNTISSWSNVENSKYFRFVAADTQNSAILGNIKLGAMRFKFIRSASNAFVRFNQQKSRLTSRATPNAWDYLQPTLLSGSYSTFTSPSPSPSPSASPITSPSPVPRIRGDAAVTGDRCVDYRDYSEWLLEYTSRSSRQDADWAGGTTDIGGGIKPDGQVTPLDRDAWLEECLYGQHFCSNSKCYE